MEIKTFLLFAVLGFSLHSHAQDLTIKVDEKGRVGFVDKDGNEVVKCQYESVQPFEDGIAIVTKSERSGIIDATGNILLPLRYSGISKWTDKLFLIKDGKKMGLANKRGEIVLPVDYTSISKPNCYGRALVSSGGRVTASGKKSYMFGAKYGVIDADGSVVIETKYKGLYEFSSDLTGRNPFQEGRALEFTNHYLDDTLKTDCRYLGYSNSGLSSVNAGILDDSGKQLVKAGLHTWVMEPKGDMVRYYDVKRSSTICGYHNLLTGEELVAKEFDSEIGEIEYWTHGDFTGDVAPLNGDSWTFIDKSGAVLRSGYSSLMHSITAGLWAAKNANGTWDVFDESNVDIVPLSGYSAISFPMHDGDKELFSVCKDSVWGCVSRAGEILVPFEYQYIFGNCYDAVAVKKNGKFGILNPDGTIKVPIEYKDIVFPSARGASHYWVKKDDTLYYHYNVALGGTSGQGFQLVNNFKDGIAIVQPKGMKVADTQVNRAQAYVPNTDQALIDKVNVDSLSGSYGYLVDTADVLIMDFPVSSLYIDKVIGELKKCGVDGMSSALKKRILLYVTRENRSYGIDATIGEEEWDY